MHFLLGLIRPFDGLAGEAMATRNVDPDYFKHPSVIAYVLLPVTWVLLPMSGYAPHLLKPYVSATAFTFLLDWSVSQLHHTVCPMRYCIGYIQGGPSARGLGYVDVSSVILRQNRCQH